MGGLEVKLKGLSIARWCRLTSPTYLLDVALQPAGLLAVSCSDFTVRLHSRDTLDLLGEYQGHRGPLCGVVFSHASPDFLYSASADGTVRGWDVRRPGTAAAQVFKGDPAHAYSGFDLSCSDTLLCAGTEQVDREDSYLVFWDVRKPGGGLLGAYSESHSDDITQVRFHPREKDRLASGSLDGLVNVFDLSRGAEEDALLATCNSDSSAGSICWAGAAYTQLLCLSANERLHLWDLGRLDTEEPLNVFGAADGRDLPQLAGGGAVDYLVGAQWLEEAQKLLVVGGANDGDVHLMECSGGGLHLLKTLERGHASIVRCFLWDAAKEALVTGGEDALLLLWKQQEAELMAGKRQSRKSESASRFKSRAHNNYSYHRGNK